VINNICYVEIAELDPATDKSWSLLVMPASGGDAREKAASGPLAQTRLPIPPETELEEVNRLGAVRVRYLRRW
jgi:hypothetical protein